MVGTQAIVTFMSPHEKHLVFERDEDGEKVRLIIITLMVKYSLKL